MFVTTDTDDSFTQEKAYSTLTKAECVFAALWHNPEGAISTEAIARYYEVTPEQVLDAVETYHEELEITDDGWCPRAAIRLGMLLNSPMATNVRSLALDVIEAHKQPTKKVGVRFLLQNADFVQWSNREIARILECSPTTVGEARKELESQGKILPFEKRKHLQGGKQVERKNQDSSQKMSTSGHLSGSNPDSLVPTTPIVKVSSLSHPRYGQEGVVVKDWDGHWQKLVRFDDGEEVAIAVTDLDAASSPFVRIPQPRTYTEEELQQAINRAIAESKIGFKVEMEEIAQAQVREQLAASQAIAHQYKEYSMQLQQRIEELESLQTLEIENQQLLSRISELERAMESRPRQEWGNTFTKQAEKIINTQVLNALENLEPELHLRELVSSPPKDAALCLQLMSLAMGNLAKVMNDAQVISSAAILLGCSATPEAVAYTVERNQMIYHAAADFRAALAKPECKWEDLQAIAPEYEVVKQDYWRELNLDERGMINAFKKAFDTKNSQCPVIQIGSLVSHSDSSKTLYVTKGRVVDIKGEEFFVHWDGYERPLLQHRYEAAELRLVVDKTN